MVSSSGNSALMRFDEGQLVGRDVVFQEERLISGHRGHALQARAQLIGRHVQPGGDLVGIGVQVAVLIAQQQHGERRIVVDDDAAFAVEDLAARRQDGDLLDAVLFGQRCVVIAARHLQAPQPEGKNQKDSQQDVLHCGEASCETFSSRPNIRVTARSYRFLISIQCNCLASVPQPATLPIRCTNCHAAMGLRLERNP